MPDMPSILTRIVARTKADLANAQPSLSELKAQIRDVPSRRGFAQAIRNAAAQNTPALIAELKKASPSAGVLVSDFTPADIAKAYEQGGATCLSVLTNTPFFQGTLAHLRAAHAACRLPVLRKDFMIDARQFYTAGLAGADAVLLIAAILDDGQLEEFIELAHSLQLDVLLEIHTKDELARVSALIDKGISPDIIGVNNRDLHKFETNISTSLTLAPLLPQGPLRLSESGITHRATIGRLHKAKYHAVLVGEHLMHSTDITAATKALLGK